MNNSEKQLLTDLNDLSDQNILDVLKVYLPKYLTILDSEKQASEILQKYGVYDSFNDTNKIMKIISKRLIEIAESRNLVIPVEYYQYELNQKDIICRIEEIKNRELSLIDLRNQAYDLIDKVISRKRTNNNTSTDNIEQINSFYNHIINKEFTEKNAILFQESVNRLFQK